MTNAGKIWLTITAGAVVILWLGMSLGTTTAFGTDNEKKDMAHLMQLYLYAIGGLGVLFAVFAACRAVEFAIDFYMIESGKEIDHVNQHELEYLLNSKESGQLLTLARKITDLSARMSRRRPAKQRAADTAYDDQNKSPIDLLVDLKRNNELLPTAKHT